MVYRVFNRKLQLYFFLSLPLSSYHLLLPPLSLFISLAFSPSFSLSLSLYLSPYFFNFCISVFAPGLNGNIIDINEHYNAIKPNGRVCFLKSNSSVNFTRDCSRDCIYSGSKVKLNGEVRTVTEILDTTGTTCNSKSRVMGNYKEEYVRILCKDINSQAWF